MKFLRAGIENLGFQRIIELKSGEPFDLGPTIQLELIASHFCDPEACGKLFTCDRWLDPQRRGQGIDSVAVFRDTEHTLVNHNDAPYFPPLCDLILHKYPNIDMNMGVYAGAGPYPQCFENLSESEKLVQAEKKKLQFIQMLEKFARHFQTKYVMPFAGQYVLGGRLAALNDYRGVADINEVGDYLEDARGHAVMNVSTTGPETSGVVQSRAKGELVAKPVLFSTWNQGAWFNLTTGEQSQPFIPENREEQADYIQHALADKKLDYEEGWYVAPRLQTNLMPLLRGATQHMHQTLSLSPLHDAEAMRKWHLYLDAGQGYLYQIGTKDPTVGITAYGEEVEPFMRISLQYSFLLMILTRHAHWNNAEIGSHLLFYRAPDVYERSLTSALSFLHLYPTPSASRRKGFSGALQRNACLNTRMRLTSHSVAM